MAMIRGIARYAKIVGAPVEGFDGGEKSKEWTFDLVVDEATEEKLVNEGVAPTKFKTDPKSGERYINFKRKAYKADDTASKPYKIVDGRGVDWTPGVLIGNGSILNVKYNIGWPENASHLNILTWCWELEGERRLIVINFSGTPSQAMVQLPWHDLQDRSWRLSDPLSGEVFDRGGDDLAAHGLFVSLQPWCRHFLRLEPAG